MNYWATARLKPGVTLTRAQSELNVVHADVDRQIEGHFEVHAKMAPLMESIVGSSRQGLLLVMAAVGAVLLVLIVNLANLSLALAAGRARDAAIRPPLGASQGPPFKHSLIQTGMRAAAGR